ncbi:hypothetical protein DL766_001971 [Monosporascus sp. MC13-8B]|uniref:Uncharacterized protein n=1 Tax=Monosporascus cannonballus TaxID=155416 RepID=A0ABY0H723_9PEZI|nr:hypothetical protein DL762_004872 [Monosporascus cannonballus]RYO99580.1 hypothetical protein DL763_001399 [Monosporascus cannonballus]RYP36469.1 hypothetical protein DL766_001971 [Monosporascus sp. MC13-8B]
MTKARPPPERRRPVRVRRLKIDQSRTKKHVAKGRVLIEATESLGTDMLGRPAQALVMKEGVYRKKRIASVILGPEPGPTDVEALLDTRSEPATPEEARANIDELWPRTETLLSEKAFRKLQKALTDGFLKSQLKDYIENFKQEADVRAHKPPAGDSESVPSAGGSGVPEEYDWIRSISPWAPLNGDGTIAEGTGRNLHGYISDSTTDKEKLAIGILRECWALSIQELSSGLGEIWVRLRNWEFTLLMRGAQRFMTRLGDTWLEPGEKIEAFRESKSLRLVTTKPKAEVLLKHLHSTLKGVTSRSIPLSILPSESLDDALLEEVGRITNTHIRKSWTQKRLHVTWIEPKTRDSRCLEDLRHIVFRFLWTALAPEKASTDLYAETLPDQSSGRFVVDRTSKDKWSWKDKMGEWARYVLPLRSETPISDLDPKPGVETREVGYPLRNLPLPISPGGHESQEASADDITPAQNVQWAKTLETSSKAYFGHLLHAYQPDALPPPLPDLLTAHHPRIFSALTPHPLHLARLEARGAAESTLVQTTSTITIRFWPSPSPTSGETAPPKSLSTGKTRRRAGQKAKKEAEVEAENAAAEDEMGGAPNTVAGAPVLELRLAATDTEITGVESLRAIAESHVSDVMLPSSPADLRVVQTRHAALEAAGGADALANWQPISDFLSNARLDLARGKLEMPPRQKFPVPLRLFSRPETSAAAGATGAGSRGRHRSPDDEDELVSTTYEFVGLELRRSVAIPYEGQRLTYTSIEAGQGGGRRAEVSLEPILDGEPEAEDPEGLQTGFLACCYNFARTNSIWSGYSGGQRRTS